ncbi:MAG: Flp family type IVb pilin [Armatimonadota bacterium]
MIAKMIGRAKWLYEDEKGATMVEYAMLIALIALVSIAIITILGTNVRDKFSGAETGTR